MLIEGWWFVHVQETDEQGWAPASCLLPENREEFGKIAASGKISLDSLIFVKFDCILFCFSVFNF